MTSWTNSIGGSTFTGALPAPQIAKTAETLRNQGFRYFGARDGTEPKATSLAITGLRYLVASFMPPKMPPKRKVPLGVCVLSPTMPKHYREGRECYAEGVTGAIPRNANFGDAGKRLPPSFGHSLGPDFLPSPLACAFGAGFQGRECTRRTGSRISASPGSVGLAAGHGARCGGALEGRKIVGYRAAQRLPRGGGCRPGAPALGSSRGLVLCG